MRPASDFCTSACYLEFSLLGLSLPLSTKKERKQEERSAPPKLHLRNSGLSLSLNAAHVQTAARPSTNNVSQHTCKSPAADLVTVHSRTNEHRHKVLPVCSTL